MNHVNCVFINEKVNKMANMNLCNEMQKSALKAAKDGNNILLTGQCGRGWHCLLECVYPNSKKKTKRHEFQIVANKRTGSCLLKYCMMMHADQTDLMCSAARLLEHTVMIFFRILLKYSLRSACCKPEDQWSCKRSPEICCIYQ